MSRRVPEFAGQYVDLEKIEKRLHELREEYAFKTGGDTEVGVLTAVLESSRSGRLHDFTTTVVKPLNDYLPKHQESD